MTPACADVAAINLGPVVGASRVRVCIRMVLPRMCGTAVHVFVTMHAMVRVTDHGGELTRLAWFFTKHGRSYRTPEGEQYANQQ